MFFCLIVLLLCVIVMCVQTLRGHEHVVETVSFGKRPRDAAAIMASSSASGASSSSSAGAKADDMGAVSTVLYSSKVVIM